MREVEVTIPIAGVAYATVLVEDDATKDEIYEAATSIITTKEHIETWGTFKSFGDGLVSNVECDKWSIDSDIKLDE